MQLPEVTTLTEEDIDRHEDDVKLWGADSQNNIQEMAYRFMCSFLSKAELKKLKKAEKKILGE